eukprot:CAMPEP_0203906786 /NCGR_PEP_ID=MMETSP0359-20131031/48369_1 /ASSEMBLY_ACC=CAM_ASM_000338 /TAXON_ID=268821 /ORGANISM="Scrippsiella Hangoei, Strain SHTV-5" /LENGTH=80 /DNA_ID=CAMNT_0050831487 /DNA_START=117 /DNA_END=356 /DNA_ORIENTATION=-
MDAVVLQNGPPLFKVFGRSTSSARNEHLYDEMRQVLTLKRLETRIILAKQLLDAGGDLVRCLAALLCDCLCRSNDARHGG